jgi:hypothetical protein
MEDLIALLEEALRRARAAAPGSVTRVRLERAESALRHVIIPAFPPEVTHREVTTLTGAHVDAAELRGFGEDSDPK